MHLVFRVLMIHMDIKIG